MATPPFFPPDVECFNNCSILLNLGLSCDCSITPSMINFLNFTENLQTYTAAYCLNPPVDDSCLLGYCPNPDIAGQLVRVSAYVTNFCLSIMVFYSPDDAREALWSQLLTMYSLLLTSWISISQRSISRLYSVLAVVITGSPLSVYLFAYAVVSFWYQKHRLNNIVGDGQIIARLLVVLAGLLWIALLIFSSVTTDGAQFAQASCDALHTQLTAVYILPFLIIGGAAEEIPWFFVVLILPVALTGLAWIIAVVLQRHNIWHRGERWRPHFGRIWKITGRQYSFVHFMLIVLVPALYWVGVLEIAVLLFNVDTPDVEFSFGQVLALFVALPPVLSVISLWPKFLIWFTSLAWVRKLTQHWRTKKPKKTRTLSLSDSDVDVAGSPYDNKNQSAIGSNFSFPMHMPTVVHGQSAPLPPLVSMPEPSLLFGDTTHRWPVRETINNFTSPSMHVPHSVREFEPNRAVPDVDASRTTGISHYYAEGDFRLGSKPYSFDFESIPRVTSPLSADSEDTYHHV